MIESSFTCSRAKFLCLTPCAHSSRFYLPLSLSVSLIASYCWNSVDPFAIWSCEKNIKQCPMKSVACINHFICKHSLLGVFVFRELFYWHRAKWWHCDCMIEWLTSRICSEATRSSRGATRMMLSFSSMNVSFHAAGGLASWPNASFAGHERLYVATPMNSINTTQQRPAQKRRVVH